MAEDDYCRSGVFKIETKSGEWIKSQNFQCLLFISCCLLQISIFLAFCNRKFEICLDISEFGAC